MCLTSYVRSNANIPSGYALECSAMFFTALHDLIDTEYSAICFRLSSPFKLYAWPQQSKKVIGCQFIDRSTPVVEINKLVALLIVVLLEAFRGYTVANNIV